MQLKEKCTKFVQEKVTNIDSHEKFLEPEGYKRLLLARDFDVQKAFEMFEKWVVRNYINNSYVYIRTGDLSIGLTR